MKKLIGILLLVCMAFIACDIGSNSNGSNNSYDEDEDITVSLLSISDKNRNIQSLYISKISVSENTRSVSDSAVQTLSFINEGGENTPFLFNTPSGKNILFDMHEAIQLDAKRLILRYYDLFEVNVVNDNYFLNTLSSYNGPGYSGALIDLENNKVYDYDEFYNNIGFISGDYLFACNLGIIHKFELNNNMSVTALNNPAFYPVGDLVPYLFGNKVVNRTSGITYSFDINNAFPPKPIIEPILGETYYGTPVVFSNTHGIIITDFSNNPYYVPLSDGSSYSISKINIDDDGYVFFSDKIEGEYAFDFNLLTTVPYSPAPAQVGIIFSMNSSGNGTFGYNDRYQPEETIIFGTDGFIILKKSISGIQVESVVLSIPDTKLDDALIINNQLFYLEGSSIMRLHLSTGSSPEIIYTNSRLLNGTNMKYLSSSGDNLLFYQMADDNLTVNTYALAIGKSRAIPQLVAAYNVEIRGIVELDF